MTTDMPHRTRPVRHPATLRPGRRPSPAPPPGRKRPGLGALIRACGGVRYAVALTVDALGAGMLRPFLLLYGVQVLHLGVAASGTAMSAGMFGGLAAVPLAGRWIDRGARTTVVAAAIVVRVLGVAVLLGAPLLGGPPVAVFTLAALFLGVGNQCWPPAHTALVSSLAPADLRDAALATGRSLRNAGLGAGALIATLSTYGGPGALRFLALVTALGYLTATGVVLSMRVREPLGERGPIPVRGALRGREPVRVRGAEPVRMRGAEPAGMRGAEPREPEPAGGPPAVPGAGATPVPPGRRRRKRPFRAGRLTVLDVANLPYAFCFNVLEVALPAFLVTRLHVSPAWSAGIFVGNTLLVVSTQILVVLWLSRFARNSALAAGGVVLAASYLGFWAVGQAGGAGAAAGVAAVSVLYTAGEIIYTGSATALVVASTDPRALGAALSRFQLSSGLGSAASPAVLTALLAQGPGLLWGLLAATTLAAAAAVRRWVPGSADRRPRRTAG